MKHHVNPINIDDVRDVFQAPHGLIRTAVLKIVPDPLCPLSEAFFIFDIHGHLWFGSKCQIRYFRDPIGL